LKGTSGSFKSLRSVKCRPDPFVFSQAGIFKEIEAIGACVTNRKHFNNVRWNPGQELRDNDYVLNKDKHDPLFLKNPHAQDETLNIAFALDFSKEDPMTQKQMLEHIQKIKEVSYKAALVGSAVDMFGGKAPVMSWASLGEVPFGQLPSGVSKNDIQVSPPLYPDGNAFFTNPWFVQNNWHY
jgi:hypothetical protein